MDKVLHIIITAVVLYFVVRFIYSFKETPEEKEKREKLEAARHENYMKLIEGVKVEITDGVHSAPEFYGMITKKVIFNSWECDHALIYFKVDVYKGENKVANKDFFDNQLKYIS